MYLQGTEVSILTEEVLVLKAAAQNDYNQLRCPRRSFEILTGESTRTVRYAGRYCQRQWLFSPVALLVFLSAFHVHFLSDGSIEINLGKGGGVKSGELAGQTAGPPRQIQSLGKILFRYSGASQPKWAGALKYRPHISVHTTVAYFQTTLVHYALKRAVNKCIQTHRQSTAI